MLYTALEIVYKRFQRARQMPTAIQINEPSRSPIFKLNTDLLHLIFRMNIEYEGQHEWGARLAKSTMGPSVLLTTRYSSQVCLLWRNILLSSPSIWAQSIDLQELDQYSDHWKEKVLRRTGSAYLHVTGSTNGHNRVSRDLFQYLISKYWSRVRIIDVVMYHPSVFTPETWNFLICPSPILQSFKLRILSRTLSSTSTLPRGSLFASDAPSLREFCVEQLPFDTRMSWFGNIRSFGVIPSSKLPIPISQVLEILSQMSLLESLTVGDLCEGKILDDGINNNSIVIHLPHLHEITFTGVDLTTCTTILDRVEPSPTCICALDLYCRRRTLYGEVGSPSMLKTSHDDDASKTVFIRYFKAFFDTHLVSTITLTQSNGVLSLEVDLPKLKPSAIPPIPMHKTQRRFRVAIDHYNPALVLDIYAACQYPGVKNLELVFDAAAPLNPSEFTLLALFMRSFSHVEKVIANKPALRICQSMTEDFGSQFPSMTFESLETSIGDMLHLPPGL